MEKKFIHYISTKILLFTALIRSYQIGVQRKFKTKINFPFLPTLKLNWFQVSKFSIKQTKFTSIQHTTVGKTAIGAS